jgi:DNA-binding NarL/FixJ family response regulator
MCRDGGFVEASTHRALRTAMQADAHIDIVIVDFCMPGVNTVELVGDIRRQRPDTKVIVLGPALHRSFILEVMKSGASGYISKQMNANIVMSAVRLVASGEQYVPAAMLALDDAPNGQVCGHDQAPDGACGVKALTDRERDILHLLKEGMPNKVIANALDISVVTVKSHLSNVFRKIGARNRVHALRLLTDTASKAQYSRACC